MATAAKLVDICAAPTQGVAQYSIAVAATTAVDLTTRSGKPDHSAQVVDFYNGGAAEQNAVFTTIDAVTLTVPIAAGARYTPPIPVSSVGNTGGANVTAIAFWWKALGGAINP
jgi:hypothetical protein